MDIPFEPTGDTIPIAATATSAQTAAAINSNSQRVRVFNAGPNVAFVRFGVQANTITADATKDMPLAVGGVEIFTKNGLTGAAAICLSGQTAALYFTPGEGQ